jgi:hypothetical protein
MDKNQNKILAEKAFWNVWGSLESNSAKNGSQKAGGLDMVEHIRRDDKEYAARIAQQQAEAQRKENLKLMAMIVAGLLAICLIVFLLGLIDMKSETSSTASGGNTQQSAAQLKEETPEMIQASIEEEVIKGGFASKEAYFSSELTKQSNDVDKDLVEFSKKIKSVNPKMNITSLVIAGKLEQLTDDKIINGFGIELVSPRDGESDNVSLISHLKGMTSSVEFFAEGGRVVAHFKDYPASYCAGTKGAAVCGS